MSARFLVLSLVSLTALACARRTDLPPPAWAFPPSAVPALAPGAEALPLSSEPPEPGSPLAKVADPLAREHAIPGGEACLELLSQRGVTFSRRHDERGVPTPVLVGSSIHGIRFFSDGMPFVTDCRLAVALSDIAPELAALGVTQVRFSGAYVYRTRRSGTLSLHAHGLAIDVHDVWFGNQRASVKKDFKRGLGRECTLGMPPLNELACRVRERRLFRELLTPDDNADHYDHLHFGLSPLPGEVPAPPPVILRQPKRKVPAAAPVASDEQELPPVENEVPEPPAAALPRAAEPAPQPETPEQPPAAPEAPPAPNVDEPSEPPGSLPEVEPTPAPPSAE